MKKLYYNILKLSMVFIFSSICLVTFAQANYSGGKGGGYASYSLNSGTFVNPADTLITSIFDVTVYPNPLRSNDVFKAKITGGNQNEKISIVVSDLIGTKLLVENVDLADEIIINIPFDRLSKGIYLITFQYNNHKITRRFSFTN
jgi:hypothetical protein